MNFRLDFFWFLSEIGISLIFFRYFLFVCFRFGSLMSFLGFFEDRIIVFYYIFICIDVYVYIYWVFLKVGQIFFYIGIVEGRVKLFFIMEVFVEDFVYFFLNMGFFRQNIIFFILEFFIFTFILSLRLRFFFKYDFRGQDSVNIDQGFVG